MMDAMVYVSPTSRDDPRVPACLNSEQSDFLLGEFFMKLLLRVIAACAVCAAIFGSIGNLWSAPQRRTLAAASWPQWRGPNRNGLSPEKGLNTDWETKPPKLLWTADGVGNGYASVSVGDGQIYTIGKFPGGESVVALDSNDGSVLWNRTSTTASPSNGGYPGPRCTPTLDGDRLYVISSDGKLACLKRSDGSLLWTRDFVKEWRGRVPHWGYSESPLVDGELVLGTPGGSEAMIVALNKNTGEEVWKSATGGSGAGYSSIVISNGAGVKQYVQLTSRGVIGVRASDGQFLWEYNKVANGTANIPTPVTTGDFVFCSTGYGAGAALLKLSRNGQEVQADEQYFLKGNEFQNHHGGMLLVGDHIYAGSGHGSGLPACVELKTGKLMWGRQRGAGNGSAAVVYFDGHIVFRYQNGTLALVEAKPQSYRLKGTLTPDYQERESWSHPVIAGGRLYLREQNKLMCYDLSK
jgi:outer membrane protein assembly factor BamB